MTTTRGRHRVLLSTRARLAAAVSTVLMVVLGAGLVVGTASAATPFINADGTPGYLCPGNAPACGESYRHTLPKGGRVTMVCWVDNAARGGRFYNVLAGPYDLFVPASRVSDPVPNAPYCPNLPAVQSSLWAVALQQQTGTTATFPTTATMETARTHLGLPLSNWGGRKDWSGDCIAFVWLAIDSVGYKSGIIAGYPSAAAQATRGSLNKGWIPPRGALVFWGGNGGWGHVAISLGSGYVATTSGNDNDQKANTVRSVTDVTRNMPYLGWRMLTERAR